MRNATNAEIELFKNRFCKDENSRKNLINYFDIDVESFEELLPGKTVRSYAFGNRFINNTFMMFRVYDTTNDIQYFPVFSESIGRKLLKEWNKKVPKLQSVFTQLNNGNGIVNGGVGNTNVVPNAGNRKLRTLIVFTRSLMILHIDDPKPMDGVLKSIYNDLEANPKKPVKSEIKSVNTALKHFLVMGINTNNENFQNLQDYIQYLQVNSPGGKRLRNTNFDELRDIMKQCYPNEHLYF